MLTPEQIVEIAETMQPLVDELNQWITRDLIERLMQRIGRGEELLLTPTDEWQLQVYQAAGGHLEAVQEEIVRFTGITQTELRTLFEYAGALSFDNDAAFYAMYGLPELPMSNRMIRILTDIYQRTNGEIVNFTRTTANASQQRLIKVLDSAHFKVISGATSYTNAVKDAVNDIVAEQTKVLYPTGHQDTIETAILRAVRTGTAQVAGAISMEGMIERDWDLIRTSAHLGARYGDGGNNPGNHGWWQGRLFSRTGRTPDYPLFEESTGYGTGEGLCGWNCRHSFGPGDQKRNPYITYDTEENKLAYDLSQKQRGMESAIRKSKSRLLAYRTAIDNCPEGEVQSRLQEEYDRTSELLRQQNKAYNEFCESHSMKRYDDRLAIAKWNRSEAAKSAATARNIEQFKSEIMQVGHTSTGVAITDVSTHIFTRSKERTRTAVDIADALTNPLDVRKIRTDRSQQFVGEFATVVINVDTGKVISCWKTTTKKAEKLKRKKGIT